MFNSKLSKVLPVVIPAAISLLVLTSSKALSEETAQTNQPTPNTKIALASDTAKPAAESPKSNSETKYSYKQDLKKALNSYIGDMMVSAY